MEVVVDVATVVVVTVVCEGSALFTQEQAEDKADEAVYLDKHSALERVLAAEVAVVALVRVLRSGAAVVAAVRLAKRCGPTDSENPGCGNPV